MLPMLSDLISIGQAIAGFASLTYISYRVWKHIANAEPIDFFPLLRPFALGLCIVNFHWVIAVINGILSPTVSGTAQLLNNTNQSVAKLMEQREKERRESIYYKMYGVNGGAGDRDLWMEYTHTDEIGREGIFGKIGNSMEFAMAKAYYNLKSWFKDLISFLLQILYEAAALCINTIRTFKLLILAILGPIVFALAIFDGFQHSLTVYLARYINYYLWLPVANILGSLLGKIQEGMIQLDRAQISQHGDSFFTTTDIGYIIFMVIGIVSYFTVPSIANMIVNAGGGSSLVSKVTNMTFGTIGTASAAAAGSAGMAADALGDVNLMINKGYSGHGTGSGYFDDKISGRK